MQKLRNPEDRPSGKMSVKFGYLHPILLKDSHNTFCDFIRFVILEQNEDFLEVKGHRLIGMAKEVAEQKYLRYLSTCT